MRNATRHKDIDSIMMEGVLNNEQFQIILILNLEYSSIFVKIKVLSCRPEFAILIRNILFVGCSIHGIFHKIIVSLSSSTHLPFTG